MMKYLIGITKVAILTLIIMACCKIVGAPNCIGYTLCFLSGMLIAIFVAREKE
jgi:hypothetical protein